jgi:acyl-CoA reductase-like NAD-dependent aldehyde dehydrogenase
MTDDAYRTSLSLLSRAFCVLRLLLFARRSPPSIHVPPPTSRVEFRPLEGFVLAVTPFNFTAIGGNLVFAPAVVGNVVLWKPSPAATYANYLTHKIFLEAGLPPSVIQFVPVSGGGLSRW